MAQEKRLLKILLEAFSTKTSMKKLTSSVKRLAACLVDVQRQLKVMSRRVRRVAKRKPRTALKRRVVEQLVVCEVDDAENAPDGEYWDDFTDTTKWRRLDPPRLNGEEFRHVDEESSIEGERHKVMCVGCRHCLRD